MSDTDFPGRPDSPSQEELDLDSLRKAVNYTSQSESPRAVTCLFWCLLTTVLDRGSEDTQRVISEWEPTEEDFALLFECLATDTSLQAVARLPVARRRIRRLLDLATQAKIEVDPEMSDLCRLGMMPNIVLRAELDLARLREATERGEAWMDPSSVLDPDGLNGVDVAPILALAKYRSWSEVSPPPSLALVIERLRQYSSSIDSDVN